jgi:ABC-type transporter Mla MlaB component
MADDPKQSESFLRKVARFVANPNTDWKEITSRQDDPESELAKAELRAMIERKRRNDFVRKRELDMLRRLRREGLTPEQLAAAGAQNSSHISDAERAAADGGRDDVMLVKDKIDQIEQQMVKEGFRPTMVPRATPPGGQPGEFDATTRAAAFAPTQPAQAAGANAPTNASEAFAHAPAAAVMGMGMSPPSDAGPSALPTLPALDMGLSFDVAGETLPAPSPPSFDLVLDSGVEPQGPAEVQELAHDPDLDEAVIAFANGDNDTCERSLLELTQPGGPRNLHADTWLVRFDYYRATGQQQPFEALALEYVHLFGLSAPQWFSIPKLVAEGRKHEKKVSVPIRTNGVNWTALERLDRDGVLLLKKRCDTAPLPWVLDWQAVKVIEAEALGPLTDLVRAWSRQTHEMRWLGGNRVLDLLREATPVGERDTDPGWWMLRLELLRVGNRPDQFDEAAIDYCVTYEVSPPSWEAARCKVRFTTGSQSTLGPSTNLPLTEGLGGFLESTRDVDAGAGAMAHLELSGQLVGDMTELLKQMSTQIGTASQVEIACPKLVRLDFIAAGDLLNWVLHQRSDNRSVQFVEAHRLVALFFGAMGINEHARIRVKAV